MRKLIVLVEDEKLLRELIRESIQSEFGEEFQVIGLGDAETATGFCLENMEIIAAVILDGKLPGSKHGWEVAAALRQEGWAGPIIYMGHAKLPEDYQALFSGKCEKDDLAVANTVKKYI